MRLCITDVFSFLRVYAGLIDILPSLLAFEPQRFGLPPFEDTVEGTIPMLVREGYHQKFLHLSTPISRCQKGATLAVLTYCNVGLSA